MLYAGFFSRILMPVVALLITVVKTFPVGAILETGFPTTVAMSKVWGTVSFTLSSKTDPFGNVFVPWAIAPGPWCRIRLERLRSE
jgi:hypothetical protein